MIIEKYIPKFVPIWIFRSAFALWDYSVQYFALPTRDTD